MKMVSGVVRQYYAISSANLISFIYGVSIGWPSATLPLLMSAGTPLSFGPISIDDASWINSILCIGGAVGTLFFGWLSEVVGRKPAMIASAVPTLITWILILVPQNVWYLYVARTLAGFAAGASFGIIPKIVAEISNDDIRGSLGSLLILIGNGGIVFGYIICSYLDYYAVSWIMIAFSCIFVVGFLPVPETPKYLSLNNQMERAETSYRYFKGLKDSSNDSSPDKIRTMLEEQVNRDTGVDKNLHWKDFYNRATIKAIFIGLNGMIITVFSGSFILAAYAETIFTESGSSLTPAISSIITGFIRLFGSYMATLLIERAGRKLLIVSTSYVTIVGLILMGVYSYLKHIGLNMESFMWIPIVLLSFLIFISSLGVGSVPFVVVGEIFAQKVQSPLISFCIITNWLWTFAMVKIFPFMMVYVGMWTLAGVCCILTVIFAIITPETKGKSIEDITEILGK